MLKSKLKENIYRVFKAFSKMEMRVLPGNVAFFFILALIPLVNMILFLVSQKKIIFCNGKIIYPPKPIIFIYQIIIFDMIIWHDKNNTGIKKLISNRNFKSTK